MSITYRYIIVYKDILNKQYMYMYTISEVSKIYKHGFTIMSINQLRQGTYLLE